MFDMVRKSLVRAKQPNSDDDFYDIFIDYLRSTMILDLIATVPQVFGGMSTKFAFLKIIRVYEINMLHFCFSKLIRYLKGQKPKSESDDLEYAIVSFCKILILLHFLSCLWIYVGSEAYIDHEPGQLPWQYANEDFHDMDRR